MSAISTGRACARGGFAGGFFAIFVPSDDGGIDIDALMARAAIRRAPAAAAARSPRASRSPLHMASLLLRIERASKRQIKVCRTAAEIRQLHRYGRARRDPPHRGRRGDRSRTCACSTCSTSAGLRSIGPVWSRSEHLRPRRAVPLSVDARHRPRPDRPRPRPDQGLQPTAHHDRPLAPQREGLLGRRQALGRASRRNALERPRHLPPFAQPHRQATGGDPREPRHGGPELRHLVPAGRTAGATRTPPSKK